MIDDSMKSHRLIGMIQPKKSGNLKKPDLHDVGCLGKITSFNETEDGRYLIIINGICRYRINSEKKHDKLYRICNVDYQEYFNDLKEKQDTSNLNKTQIIKNFKIYFKKKGYLINWKELEKQTPEQTINALAMASPFSLEEKQVILESKDLNSRQKKIEEISKTYILDEFSNKTLQ